MSAAPPRTFELVPKRRFLGSAFGRHRSTRRGQGDEVAGTRPYRPGDLPAHIDWAASARLSAARGADEFVVREFYADEAPRVALACDRRPAMGLPGGPPPWLDKAAAVLVTVELIAASAAAEAADVAYADGHSPRPAWTRAGARRAVLARRLDATYDAAAHSLQLALDGLVRDAAALPAGSFVFAVSDFLEPVRGATWLRLRALGWDVVPVIVQDPVWERSFPQVGGVVLPLADAAGGGTVDVWLSRADARRRAEENERRYDGLLERFRKLGFDPVTVATADPAEIAQQFGRWAERRRRARAGR